MLESSVSQFALIGLLGLLCQVVAWRTRIPAILFLLVMGVITGPWLGWLHPDLLLGHTLFPIVSICVALILFEGSLTLNYQEIREQSKTLRLLITLGALITWLCVALAVKYWINLPWNMAFLIGAIAMVSGPTVITPLLKSVRPQRKIGTMLRWESIIVDPIGALTAVLVYEFIITASSDSAISHILIALARIVFFSGTLGLIAGLILGWIIRWQLVPNYLQNLTTISLVLVAFALANTIQHESGLLAVTVMGVTLANMKRVSIEEILSFKEHLTMLLISGVFIILAAKIHPEDIIELGLPALFLLLTIQCVVRPFMVFLVTIKSGLTIQEKIILSWIYPRGIVAAAIASLFALQLTKAGVAGADMIVPLTFMIIIVTVILQSLTAKPLARSLNMTLKDPTGIFFIGANEIARELAKTLQAQGINVLLADSHWDHIKKARMENLSTFYGNPMSEYADMQLDLDNMGYLLATSPLKDLNALACSHFRTQFGRNNLYYISNSAEAAASAKHRISEQHKGNVLVDQKLTYSQLTRELRKGGKMKVTTLSDSFTFDNLLKREIGTIPLIAIDKKNTLVMFHEHKTIKPKAGWRIISFVLSEPDLR